MAWQAHDYDAEFIFCVIDKHISGDLGRHIVDALLALLFSRHAAS